MTNEKSSPNAQPRPVYRRNQSMTHHQHPPSTSDTHAGGHKDRPHADKRPSDLLTQKTNAPADPTSTKARRLRRRDRTEPHAATPLASPGDFLIHRNLVFVPCKSFQP